MSPFLCLAFGFLTFTGCNKTDTPPALQQASPLNNTYQIGDVIRFGAGGGSERFRREGWSDTEKEFTWTTGQSAKLAFSIPASTERFDLRMRLTGLIKPPELPSQPVEVFANGEKIAVWEVAQTADFTAQIPAALRQNGAELTIELKTPKATSPKALGLSEDARILGVLCSELALTKGG